MQFRPLPARLEHSLGQLMLDQVQLAATASSPKEWTEPLLAGLPSESAQLAESQASFDKNPPSSPAKNPPRAPFDSRPVQAARNDDARVWTEGARYLDGLAQAEGVAQGAWYLLAPNGGDIDDESLLQLIKQAEDQHARHGPQPLPGHYASTRVYIPVIKEVIKEVQVIKEVVKQVTVTSTVTKEVTKEVEVVREVAVPYEVVKEVIVEKVKEVPVVKEVVREVIKEVPVEVIKEVPVPVEAIVEVAKEVPCVRIVEMPASRKLTQRTGGGHKVWRSDEVAIDETLFRGGHQTSGLRRNLQGLNLARSMPTGWGHWSDSHGRSSQGSAGRRFINRAEEGLWQSDAAVGGNKGGTSAFKSTVARSSGVQIPSQVYTTGSMCASSADLSQTMSAR